MKEKCKCPFCETELVLQCFEPVFCSLCGVKFTECKKCGQTFNSSMKKCPACGAKNVE